MTTPSTDFPATLSQPIERQTCPGCDNPVRYEDITIRQKKPGLGQPRRQHIEAHCRHCGGMVEIDREFNGMVWQNRRLSFTPRDEQTAAQAKRRADLERGIQITREKGDPTTGDADEFSAEEELSHDSNGGA